MAKARIWSSGAGIISLLFYAAAIAGMVLQFLEYYLAEFTAIIADIPGNVVGFILCLVFFLGALLGLIAIIMSFFGVPKALWIVFALGTLICIGVWPVIELIGGTFPYIDITFASTTMMDFIGFWMGVGGAFLATIIGFFVPAEY